MKRVINWLALLFLIACEGGPRIPVNRYGLAVVPDRATYEQLASRDPGKRLVNLQSFIPGLRLDIRYATTNNFMHQQLYPEAIALLRQPAAVALRNAQHDLAREGLGLKIFDAYRPYSVTERMWAQIKKEDYVAHPARGSRHNRGAAVDLTLVDLRTGDELPMPTAYDDFTRHAAHEFNDLPAEVMANRAKLREVMSRHGFDPLPSEWWHYDFRGWQRFELMNVPLPDLRTE